VITEDEVMRLLERADPARVDDSAPFVDAAGYLAALRTRSTTVTLIDTEPTPTGPMHRHRWPIIAVAAAAVVAIVVGGLVLANRDDHANEQIPAATTVAPDPPDASIDPDADQVAAEHALFRLSDFPAGWSEVPDTEPTEQADYQRRTAECVGSDRSRLVDLGGANASTGVFTTPTEETISETVSFGPSVAEAEDLLGRFAAPNVAECFGDVTADLVDGRLQSGMTLGDVTVARLNVAEAGDQVVAYRVTIPVNNGGSTVNVYADLVLVRSGRAVAGLAFQSQSPQPFVTEVIDQYVALATEQLAAAS
jgi:hypothetical protein